MHFFYFNANNGQNIKIIINVIIKCYNLKKETSINPIKKDDESFFFPYHHILNILIDNLVPNIVLILHINP